MPKDRISVVGGGVGQLFLKLAFLILILEHVSSSSTSHPISNSALHEKDVNKPRPTDEDEAEAGSASQQQAKLQRFNSSRSRNTWSNNRGKYDHPLTAITVASSLLRTGSFVDNFSRQHSDSGF
ncbi:hypothetical protein F5887DRAFT_504264 [Amanita rubescens]|nr:hypothetical protein F5887DRAFT_363634 [Amanita rubescens]KAF8349633.1 hypothetical protein F5887DRAFT_504264 [Amanita rubescens]